MTSRPVKKRIDQALIDLKSDEGMVRLADGESSSAHEHCGEDFEIIIDTVKDGIENKNSEFLKLKLMFTEGGLDPLNAFHWGHLMLDLAQAYAPRAPGRRAQPKSKVDLRRIIEAVAKKIRELEDDPKNKHTKITAEKAFEAMAADKTFGTKAATIKRKYHAAKKSLGRARRKTSARN